MKQPEPERTLPRSPRPSALSVRLPVRPERPGLDPGNGLPMALKVGRGACAPPFIVMDVITAANARAAALAPDAPGVIRMEVGQPGTGAPAGAAEAAMRALSAGMPLGYTEAFGLPSLRARIARHYAEHYGLDVPPARVAVTVGASGAFPLAFLAAFDPGDAVAMAAPFYPPYANILTALGMKPLLLALRCLHAFPADRGDAGAARSAPRRPGPRQPLQPRRHHAASRGVHRPRPLVRGGGRAPDLG